jgi:two-component system, OmpR family, phosphate regulon response regulator PhoB
MPDISPKRVLIVDDEMDMRIFMKTLFETSGWQPVVTRDGAQGLAEARREPPDLIVLDVMMPGEGGALMYRGLKSDSRLANIPVIMLSAVKPDVFHHYLKMLGARSETPIPLPDAYMEKPPEIDALLELANRLVAS